MVGVFGMVESVTKNQSSESLSDELFGQFKDELKKINDGNKVEIKKNDVILFFSFDIVNSSLYKTINSFNWITVINQIFKYIDKSTRSKIEECELWRILGDESIYIVRIKDKEKIYKYVDFIFEILCEVNNYITKGFIFDDINMGINSEILKMQNILSLKAASWIAIVGNNLESADSSIENVCLKINDFASIKNSGFIEFLGKDIDTGFRISKETRSRRLVLSFELACILKDKSDYLSKLKLITFKQLKGVWNQKLYPIIWFHDEKIFQNVKFEESFQFDELEIDELSREYFNNIKGHGHMYINKEMYKNVKFALEKILVDRKLESKIQKILDTINSSSKKEINYTNITLLEMHCVAICFKKENNLVKILVVQRSNERSNLPGKWEFGCAKANYKNHIIDTIKKEYKDDFNIEIEPICTKDRKDKQPIPIFVYEIKKEVEDYHKGVIFLAECVKDENINCKKHKNYKWIEESDIEGFKDDECVDDFKHTLKIAFEKIKKIVDKGEVKETCKNQV